jgi:hypothetical protein
LNILPGHGATAGGGAQLGLIDAAKWLQANDPNLVGFTALNDAAHKYGLGSGPNGAHGQGRAFDAASRDIEGSKNRLRGYLASQGFAEGAWGSGLGDFSMEPGAGGGTGPHMHFQWNRNASAARYAKAYNKALENLGRVRTPQEAVDRAIGAQSFLQGGGMGANGVVHINLHGNLRDVNATTKIAGGLFKKVNLNRGETMPSATG